MQQSGVDVDVAKSKRRSDATRYILLTDSGIVYFSLSWFSSRWRCIIQISKYSKTISERNSSLFYLLFVKLEGNKIVTLSYGKYTWNGQAYVIQ